MHIREGNRDVEESWNRGLVLSACTVVGLGTSTSPALPGVGVGVQVQVQVPRSALCSVVRSGVAQLFSSLFRRPLQSQSHRAPGARRSHAHVHVRTRV